MLYGLRITYVRRSYSFFENVLFPVDYILTGRFRCGDILQSLSKYLFAKKKPTQSGVTGRLKIEVRSIFLLASCSRPHSDFEMRNTIYKVMFFVCFVFVVHELIFFML